MPQLEDIRQRYILDTSLLKTEAKAAASAIGSLNTAVNKGTVASARNTASVKKQSLALRGLKAAAREVQSAYRLALRRAGALAVAAIAGSLGKAATMAARFEKEMATVSTAVDTTTVSMEQLRSELLRVAKSTPVSLSDLARGLSEIVQAGVPAAEAVQFLGVAAKAAVAGVTSADVAVSAMLGSMKAWGKTTSDATDIADTFFIAVRDGMLTFEEMANQIGVVAPNAAALGVTIEETSAAIAAMTLQSIKADEAATALRGFFAAVINPGKEAAETAESIGLAWGEQAIKSKGFTQFMTDLRDATQGNVTTLAKLVPNVRALTGVNALLGSGFKDLIGIIGNLENKSQGLAQAYERMNRTTTAMWDLFKNQFSVVMIQLGDKILPTLNDTMQTFITHLESMQSPGEAAVSILDRMGSKSRDAANQMNRVVELQRLMAINETLRKGAPLGNVSGFQTDFSTQTPGFFSRSAVTTRTPFASMEEALKKRQENILEAMHSQDRIIKIQGLASEQMRELTDLEQFQTDALFEQVQALEYANRELDEYIKALNDREEIMKRMAKPNFVADPFVMHGGNKTGTTPREVIPLTDEELRRLEAARDALAEVRFEISLMDEPNERVRDLMIEQWKAQKDLIDLIEIGKTKGLESVDNEIKRLQEYVDLLDERLAKERLSRIGPLGTEKGFKSVTDIAESREGLGLRQADVMTLAKMRVHFEAIAKSLGIVLDDTGDWKDGLEEALEAAAAIARALRDLNMPELAALVEGASGILGGIDSLKTATSFATQLTAGAGILGGIGVLASALTSNEQEQRRLREAFNTARQAIEDYSEAILSRDIISSDLTQDQIDLARNARAGLPSTDLNNGRAILQNLVNEGIIDQAFVDMLNQFRDEIPNFVPDETVWNLFLRESGILDALDDVTTRAGQFGDSLDGARKAAELAGVFGTEQDQVNAFLDQLLKLDISEELRNQIKGGFDLSSESGRAALRAFVEALVASLIAGDERFLGGQLTTEDIEDMKDFLVDFIPDSDSIDDISRSVMIQRTITEIQANELIAIQETALLTLERILDAVRMGQSDSGNTYNISIDIPADTTDFGRRILEEIEQEIRLKEAS